MDRNTLRKEKIKDRDSLTAAERTELSRSISRRILGSEAYSRAETLLIYKGVRGEVRLDALEEAAAADGKRLAYPLCVGPGEMIAVAADPRDGRAWKKGAYGIMEPVRDRAVEIAPSELDLVICPCTVFDEMCGRMGMGAGYYDRYLTQCGGADIAAAAFEVQKAERVPMEPWDRPMDMVFTESGVYRRGAGRKQPEPNQNTETENMILYVKSGADGSVVRAAEERLRIRASYDGSGVPAGGCYLQLDEDGLALVEHGHELRGDFTKLLPRLIPNNLNGELLVKASKLRGVQGPLTAVDATAGLGEDAFLLAAAGFQVQMYERNPVIAALLWDALRRGLEHPELSPVLRRMELRVGDSMEALPALSPPPDIIVLDPMFPKRQKSGLIKKKFQLLQQLEAPCEEEEALLQAAVSCRPRRIVIKRPLKGPYLGDVKPSYSIKGKSIRYDCVVVPQSSGCLE